MKKHLIILITLAFIPFLALAKGDKSKLVNTQWKLTELRLNGVAQQLPTHPDSLGSLSFVASNQMVIKAGKQINHYSWDVNNAGNKLLLNNTPESDKINVAIESNTITFTILAQNVGNTITIVQKFTKMP